MIVLIIYLFWMIVCMTTKKFLVALLMMYTLVNKYDFDFEITSSSIFHVILLRSEIPMLPCFCVVFEPAERDIVACCFCVNIGKHTLRFHCSLNLSIGENIRTNP
jgi:hypothetical protein